MPFKNFDSILSRIYEDNLQIGPFVYLSTHFGLIKNEVDIYAFNNEIKAEKHLELIQIIKQHEKECLHNCRNNFTKIL